MKRFYFFISTFNLKSCLVFFRGIERFFIAFFSLLQIGVSPLVLAQCGGGGVDLSVQNPSFEGPSQAHVVPSPWNACYGTPDTQPGQWGFTQAPSNGTSYISALQSGTPGAYQEGASQQLSSCMVAGTTYSFTLDLAFSNVYNTAEPLDCYGSLQIWGASTMCGKDETLWQSGVITNTNWQTFTISLTPTQNWCYISMAPYHITNCSGYINIMIDNLGPIVAPGPGIVASVNSDISCSQTILGEITCPADSVILSGLFNGSPVYANILTDSTWSKNVIYPPGSAGSQTISILAYTQNGDTLTSSLTFNLVEITPDFSPVNVCLGNPINFTNNTTITSGSIVGYQWDFGDGSGTSSLQNPSYTYSSTGTYSVQLIVTSDLGCIDSITKTVEVFENPVANFSVGNVCLNSISSFTNQSTISTGTISSASWNFGDGSGTASSLSPTYSYISQGTFNVSMTVISDKGCSATVAKPTIINPLPNANFSATDVCLDQLMNFSNSSMISPGSISSYSWNFGDSFTSSQQNPTHIYLSPGTFSVTLTAISDSGCIDIFSNNVIVNPLPVADFNYTAACPADTIIFSDASTISSGSITGWNWDFDNGSGNSILQNATFVYSSAGTFNTRLIVTSNSGCFDTIIKPVQMFEKPIADFSAPNKCLNFQSQFTNQSSIVSGTLTTANWDFGDGSGTSSVANPVYLYPAVGTYNVSLIITSDNGCTDTVNKNTVINPLPNADFIVNNVCDSDTMYFFDASTISSGNVVSYNWNFGDLSTSVLQNPSHIYASAGNYNVFFAATSDSLCVGSTSKSVVVNPLPVANFTVNNVCLDDMAVFTNTSTISSGGIVSWYWDFGNSNNSTSQNTSHQYLNDGNYNIALIVISDSGCSDTVYKPLQIYPEPVAAFSTNNVCKYDSAQFTDGSTVSNGNISSFIWNFGDGFNSSLQNPSHLYNSAGTFNVIFTVATNNGCVDSITQSLTVFPVPVADFSTNDVCQYTAAQFTDGSTITSGSVSSFQWDFGDGSNSSLQNPSHNFPSDSTLNVELLVTSDSGCRDSITKPIVIFPVPVADFFFENECLYDAVQFFDLTSIGSGYYTSDWDFGDGGNSSQPSPSHLYSADGTYNVVLIVTSGNNCSDTIMKQDTLYPIPVADFSLVDGDDCLNDSAEFTDQSAISGGIISNLNWDFGDGSSASSLQNPVHLYPAAGSYSVTLIASSLFNCTDTITKTIVQFPIPSANFDADSVCFNNSTFFTDLSIGNGDTINKWTWIFGDGSPTSSLQNPSHLYSVFGDFYVTLIVETSQGCTDYIIDTIPVYPLPIADFVNDTVCKNEPPTFFNSDNSSGNLVAWDWNFGDNLTSSLQNPTHIFQNDGMFNTQLIVTTDMGCKDTIIKQVPVHPLPFFTFNADPTAECEPVYVNFTPTIGSGTSVSSWFWDFGDGNISYLQNPSNPYSLAGSYSVELIATSNDNCTDTMKKIDYILVFPNPVAGFDFSPQSTTILNPNIDFTDLSNGANKWYWDFGDSDTASFQNPVHEYSDTGTFIIMQLVTNQFGCKDTLFQTVIIKPEFIIYIPNAFTPDGDGINDNFSPKGAGFKNENYSLFIFDRWGDMVYETHNAIGFWDGNLNGKPAKQDVYVFKLEVEDFFDTPHKFVGKVTLLRR